jgi:hypothetical protein
MFADLLRMFNTTVTLSNHLSTNVHRWTKFPEVIHNTTIPNSSFPLPEEYMYIPLNDFGRRTIFILGTLLFCFGMAGNLITVLVIAAMKSLHSPTYVTIACLAMSDCMASTMRYVRFLLYVVYNETYNSWMSELAISCFLFSHSANFHIVLLAYIRYVLIVKPLQSLNITCKRVFKLSARIWAVSFAMTGVCTFKHLLFVLGKISYDLHTKTDIGVILYVVGVPFVLLICFHVRKVWHLRNTNNRPKSTVKYSMLVMFSIIITIYLITALYPMMYGIIGFECQYCTNELCDFFLLINNSVNPFIYFAFSPPVSQVLSRLRKFVLEIELSNILRCLPASKVWRIPDRTNPRGSEDIKTKVTKGSVHRTNAVFRTVENGELPLRKGKFNLHPDDHL